MAFCSNKHIYLYAYVLPIKAGQMAGPNGLNFLREPLSTSEVTQAKQIRNFFSTKF